MKTRSFKGTPPDPKSVELAIQCRHHYLQQVPQIVLEENTVAARVLGQVGLSPTKNFLYMFSNAACFLPTTVFFLSTILVSVILQKSLYRWLGLGYALPKQANNPSAQCLTAVAIDRFPYLGSIFRAQALTKFSQSDLRLFKHALLTDWHRFRKTIRSWGRIFLAPKNELNCLIQTFELLSISVVNHITYPFVKVLCRVGYRNAVDCIQGKLERKRLGQNHRIRKGY